MEKIITYRFEQKHQTRDEISVFYDDNKRTADEYASIGWKVTPLVAASKAKPVDVPTADTLRMMHPNADVWTKAEQLAPADVPVGAVLTEVMKERAHQDERWGGANHDDQHTLKDFVGFIERYTRRVLWDTVTSRKALIQVAALAVAACESLDRKAVPPTWFCKACTSKSFCESIQGCDISESGEAGIEPIATPQTPTAEPGLTNEQERPAPALSGVTDAEVQDALKHIDIAMTDEHLSEVRNALESFAASRALPVLLGEADKADMFWDNDDSERQHGSIEEMLNEYICDHGLEIGAEFTIQQATRLPNIKIRVTAIDDNECEAEYEVIAATQSGVNGGAR